MTMKKDNRVVRKLQFSEQLPLEKSIFLGFSPKIAVTWRTKVRRQLTRTGGSKLSNKSNDLQNNIENIHTTELGEFRIKRNLDLNDDVVNWCKQEIKNMSKIYRKGKNWYAEDKNKIITINAHSFTIITAHKK